MPSNSRLAARTIGALGLFCWATVGASPLFEQDTTLELQLTGPIVTLIDEESTDEELPFTLTAEGTDHQIQVRLRGKSRLRVCTFPPLRLNFVASAVEGSIFEDQDRLKLVTHCRDRVRSEQDVLLEYAAYRIFNLISDVSYRVRPVRINYTDTSAEEAEFIGPKFGFLIESSEELSSRVGAEEAELEGIARGALDPRQAARVYVFQYLIANTDWSLVTADGDDHCCHNANLFSADSGVFLVPYDFDLSGLVNARYARPDSSLGISRVTNRLYRGYCVSPAALAAAVEHINGLREEITAVPERIPGLSARKSSDAVRFLERYYERASDHEAQLERFQANCL